MRYVFGSTTDRSNVKVFTSAYGDGRRPRERKSANLPRRRRRRSRKMLKWQVVKNCARAGVCACVCRRRRRRNRSGAVWVYGTRWDGLTGCKVVAARSPWVTGAAPRRGFPPLPQKRAYSVVWCGGGKDRGRPVPELPGSRLPRTLTPLERCMNIGTV